MGAKVSASGTEVYRDRVHWYTGTWYECCLEVYLKATGGT